MSDKVSTVSTEWMEPENTLGPVLFRCRLRPQKDVLTDAGFIAPPAQYVWVGMAIVLGAFMLLVPLFAILHDGLEMDDDTIWRVFCVVYPLNLLLLGWVSYGWPRGDYLVMYEHGFRYRITYKRLTVAFDELIQFRVGWDVPAWLKVTSTLGELKYPGLGELTQKCSEYSATVVLNNGKKHVLKGFLIRFDSEDTAHFLQHLVEKFPHLVNPPD